MKLTEDDPELARLGFLAAASKRPPSEIAKLSSYEQDFWSYWIRKERSDKNTSFWETMGRKLGTIWYKSDFEEREGSAAPKPDKDRAEYALSVLVSQNKLIDFIKKGFEASGTGIIGEGKYRAKPGEKIEEMGDMNLDEFNKLMGGFV